MTTESTDMRPAEAVSNSMVFLRLVLSVIGCALALSAFGLWLMPGASGLPELSLMKLGLSLFLLLSGLCCLVTAEKQK